MDERQGSIEARRRGLKTVGTLGVLDDAATRGLSTFPRCFGGSVPQRSDPRFI
jgi:hypothetical protein